MEIKAILSSLYRNKSFSILMIIQIGITLGVVTVALFTTLTLLEGKNRATHVIEENLIAVTPERYDLSINIEQTIHEDLKRLRALPNVIDVTPARAIPLELNPQVQVYVGTGDEIREVNANIFDFTIDGLNAMQIEIVAGRAFTENEVLWVNSTESSELPPLTLISETMAKVLYPDGDALGSTVWYGENENPAEIIGIYKDFMGGERMNNLNMPYRTIIRPMVSWGATGKSDPTYLLRVTPDNAPSMLNAVRDTFYVEKGRYIHKVEVLTRTKKRMYDGRTSRAVTLQIIGGILTLLTAFGISSLVSFLVTQRTKQIGTRRALGATQWEVVRYFLIENSILAWIGMLVSIVVTIVLTFFVSQSLGESVLQISYLIVTALILWAVCLLAAWIPARRAARIAPAVAIRSIV